MAFFRVLGLFLVLFTFTQTSFAELPKETIKSDEKCPPPLAKPKESTFAKGSEDKEKASDPNEEISNIASDIVNHELLSTDQTLFNFIKLIYTEVDSALEKYKKDNDLDEDSMSLVFKGGNVMRMIANRSFDLLPEEASALLKDKYAEYFKRSDTDFSIDIDENKIGKKDYQKVFDDVTDLVTEQLKEIREEFIKNPKEYFALLRLSPYKGSERLAKYFEELKNIDALKDKASKWYKAEFKQLQLLKYRANKDIKCAFNGQYDSKSQLKGKNIVNAPTSDEPQWIVNLDIRDIEDRWKSDPTKRDKFNLGKSKIVFDIIYEKNGKLLRKPIGGELADFAVIHRDDDTLEEFLKNYDQNVAEYKLSLDADDNLVFKGYSVPYLARNIRSIIFDSYGRPWDTGSKYNKRIYRLFFLSILEFLGSYGLGSSQINEYIDYVRKSIIEPMDQLYPLNKNAKKLGIKIERNVNKLNDRWPDMVETNAFWEDMAKLVKDRLIAKPEQSDQQEFKGLIDLINTNLDITEKLGKMPYSKFDINELYSVDMKDFT